MVPLVLLELGSYQRILVLLSIKVVSDFQLLQAKLPQTFSRVSMGDKSESFSSSLVAQQVKDPALSLPWLEFDSWPGNFCMPCHGHASPTPPAPKKAHVRCEQFHPTDVRLNRGVLLCAQMLCLSRS